VKNLLIGANYAGLLADPGAVTAIKCRLLAKDDAKTLLATADLSPWLGSVCGQLLPQQQDAPADPEAGDADDLAGATLKIELFAGKEPVAGRTIVLPADKLDFTGEY